MCDVRFVFWCCGVLCCVVVCGVGAGVGAQCVVCGVCGMCACLVVFGCVSNGLLCDGMCCLRSVVGCLGCVGCCVVMTVQKRPKRNL